MPSITSIQTKHALLRSRSLFTAKYVIGCPLASRKTSALVPDTRVRTTTACLPVFVFTMSRCTKCLTPLPYTITSKTTTIFEQCSSASIADSYVDMMRVMTAVRRLQASGFYYEKLNLVEAGKLLENTPVGTFLVRDSSDPRYLFALSVQTERGPTSIRIQYADGRFKLDAVDNLMPMPVFMCVLELVDFYVRLTKSDKTKSNHVWLDQNGRRDLQIQLIKPLARRVSTLQHLCRINIHKCTKEQDLEQLPLPNRITSYLRDYPYPQ